MTLFQLADAVEKASGKDRRLDRLLCELQYPGDKDMARMAERGSWSPTSSIDQAMQLVPDSDWEWSLEWQAGSHLWSGAEMIAIAKIGNPDLRLEGEAVSPALAMCAAALRARAAALRATGSSVEGEI